VCQENLAQAARALDLGRFIKSDRSMRASGHNNSKATLADAVEAINGAVFIDGGLNAAQAMIWHILGVPPVKIVATEKDAKTRLQEIIQAKLQSAPKYVVLEASGPPHAPTFVVAVTVNEEIIATATGESKKNAAQNAAIAALAIAAKKLVSP
jgi:ribonuclease-3